MDAALVTALTRAVEAAPDDTVLRLHLASVLLEGGDNDAAMAQLGEVLSREPANAAARELLTRALTPSRASTPPKAEEAAAPTTESTTTEPATESRAGFDWSAAESEVGDLVDPMFVEGGPEPETSPYDIETSTTTLADVGGMTKVKARLNSAFLAPLNNPELRALYGKSLRGGLLLYGPPGCGKTFLARAIAGELGAKFITVGLSDILDPYIGNSENNVHQLFQLARRSAPVVVFLDELDALGQRRSMTRNNVMRNVVVQLLQELDGVSSVNDGVFILAATNQPWDIDPALRRPGRLDRTLLVLPPDGLAREAIFQTHLKDRPIEGIRLSELSAKTEGYTGADIAYVCELASENALLDSVDTGTARMIGMKDLLVALGEVRPSTGPWMDSARNVVQFGEDDGTFDELRAFLKRSKRL